MQRRHRHGEALEEKGEEKADGPRDDETDDGPGDDGERFASEDPSVEEQRAALCEAERQDAEDPVREMRLSALR